MFSNNGNCFYFHRETSNGHIRWRCARRLTAYCRAAIYTLEGVVLNCIGEHNHGPNCGDVEIRRYQSNVRSRARETLEPPNVVIGNAAEQVHLSAAATATAIYRNTKR